MKYQAFIILFNENGRKNPIHSNYRPHFQFTNGISTDGLIKFEREPIKLGETAEVTLKLINESTKLESGLEFKFLEGAKEVGAGIIL